MCYGNWHRFWAVPYHFGGLVGILFYLALLILVVWAVVTLIKSLTSHQEKTTKNVGAK